MTREQREYLEGRVKTARNRFTDAILKKHLGKEPEGVMENHVGKK